MSDGGLWSTALSGLRPDLEAIAAMVPDGARVLDVGCGDGTLLAWLAQTKNVNGRGIELQTEGVNECVRAGLSVIQGDADTDLAHYPENAFDLVILSQTLQATRQPRDVLENLVRIGRRAIVSFPNFGHWRVRWHLGIHGVMPMSAHLPNAWWDTPNIHLCTIRDFVALCADIDIEIVRGLSLDGRGRARPLRALRLANLLGQQGVFQLQRRAGGNRQQGRGPR